MNRSFVEMEYNKDDRNNGASRRKNRAMLRPQKVEEPHHGGGEKGDLIVTKEAITGGRHDWDCKRAFTKGPARRWLQKNAGKRWDTIRAEFLEKIGGDKMCLSNCVYETNTVIDGDLHLIPSYGDPIHIENVSGPHAYVDLQGILRWIPKKKFKNTPEKKHLLLHNKLLWYRNKNGLIFKVDPKSFTTNPLVEVHNTWKPVLLHGHLHIGNCREIPELQGKAFPTKNARQVAPSKAPPAALLLEKLQD
jgi:hypothetical protein